MAIIKPKVENVPKGTHCYAYVCYDDDKSYYAYGKIIGVAMTNSGRVGRYYIVEFKDPKNKLTSQAVYSDLIFITENIPNNIKALYPEIEIGKKVFFSDIEHCSCDVIETEIVGLSLTNDKALINVGGFLKQANLNNIFNIL